MEDRGLLASDAPLAGRWPGAPYATEPIPAAPAVLHDLPRRRLAHFGFAPLLAYLDRGQAPGEPLAGLLRPGNAAPGAADDLIALVDLGPGPAAQVRG